MARLAAERAKHDGTPTMPHPQGTEPSPPEAWLIPNIEFVRHEDTPSSQASNVLVREDGYQVDVWIMEYGFDIYVDAPDAARDAAFDTTLPHWERLDQLTAQAVLFELQKNLPIETYAGKHTRANIRGQTCRISRGSCHRCGSIAKTM